MLTTDLASGSTDEGKRLASVPKPHPPRTSATLLVQGAAGGVHPGNGRGRPEGREDSDDGGGGGRDSPVEVRGGETRVWGGAVRFPTYNPLSASNESRYTCFTSTKVLALLAQKYKY
jgi:hypothetical protein